MKTLVPNAFKPLGKTRRHLEAPQRRSEELTLYLCIFLFMAGAATAAVLFPIATISIVGSIALFLAVTAFRLRHPALPPPVPLRCPACGSEQLDVLSSGMWSGRDAKGKGTGGGFEYAVCKKCRSPCAQYVDGQPFIPTEEQWNQHFEPREKHRVAAQKWPFIADDHPQAN